MAYVRITHQGAPIRPTLTKPRIVTVQLASRNPQVIPIRPPLTNPQIIPIRPPLRNPQVVPIRPFYQAIPRVPIQYRTPVSVTEPLPRYLPVLQPPIFPREPSYYEEENEQQYEEIFNYPTVVVTDQYRIIPRPLPRRAPTFMPLRNYTKQSYQYAKPNYPLYTYYGR